MKNMCISFSFLLFAKVTDYVKTRKNYVSFIIVDNVAFDIQIPSLIGSLFFC